MFKGVWRTKDGWLAEGGASFDHAVDAAFAADDARRGRLRDAALNFRKGCDAAAVGRAAAAHYSSGDRNQLAARRAKLRALQEGAARTAEALKVARERGSGAELRDAQAAHTRAERRLRKLRALVNTQRLATEAHIVAWGARARAVFLGRELQRMDEDTD